MTQRRKLSRLGIMTGRFQRVIDNGRDTLKFYTVQEFGGQRKVLFQLSPDDLFDGEGMLFENDLPIRKYLP